MLMPLTRFCTRHPIIVIVLTVLVTAAFGYFIKVVERDHSMERMLPDNEPIRTFYNEYRKNFDLKSSIIIGIESPEGVFTPEVLNQIERLSKALAALDEIEKVRSITTIENISAKDGMVDVENLGALLPATPKTAQKIAQAVRSNPMLKNAMVSADETATILFAQPTYEAYHTASALAGYKVVKSLIDADSGPGTIHMSGFPIVVGLINQAMDRDNHIMLPIIALVVVLILWFSFRSLRGVWIPLTVVAATSVWTFGAIGFLGIKTTIISTSIPIVLFAMGIADGIHVLHEYYHHLRLGHDNDQAILHTMEEMNTPVVMTSFTTAAGFLALSTARIIPIREFGGAVAFGVLAAMVISLFFIPAALTLLGRPKNILPEKIVEAGLMDRICTWIGRFSLRHYMAVILVFIVALATTSALSCFLHVDHNPAHEFRENSEIRKSDAFLNANFAGTGEMMVLIDGGRPDTLKDPALIDKIRRFQDKLESVPMVGYTLSVADFLMRMNVVLNDDDPAYNRVPGTKMDLGDSWSSEKGRAKIAQYLLLYETSGGEEIARVADFNYQKANITIHVKSTSSMHYQTVMDEITAAYAQIFTPGEQTIGVTGHGAINLKVVQYLVLGQVMSLLVSFFVVFALLIILFRSLPDAIIGVIPLVITVTMNFAVMVTCGIALNMATALIASVIIGVGVDYSIHFIHRYRLEIKRSDSVAKGVETTMHTSGRAIIFNAVSVGGGFAVLLFSSFLPLVHLGLLVPLVMIVNAVAALFVIPAFLNWRENRNKAS